MILGVDGQDEAPVPSARAAVRLPSALTGLAIAPDGTARGLDLPSLDVRGAAEAWRAALGRDAILARFDDRLAEPALARVQRLARVGEVWLDGPVPDVDAALDLLIAGAARLVLWGPDAELLEAVGDSAVVGWDGTRPFEAAAQDAAAHQVPLVAYAPPPSTVPDLYVAPAPPWTGRVEVPASAPAAGSEDE